MGFKDLHLKLKAFRLRRFFIRDVGNRKNETDNEKRPSWMMPVSHGYHAVDHQSFRSGGGSNDSDSDSVVVQREQIEDMEVWFFGVFHARIGDGVTKYMQSNLFDKKPKESHLVEKSKRIMKKAYLGARAKIRETEKQEETWKVGSASAIVINGNKLVIADMGDYRTVVCRDGEAQQISRRPKRRWSRKLIPGAIRMPKVRILACDSGIAVGTKPSRSLEFAVGSERIDSDIEFVILASNGIWEVMKHQEAVNLIRHIEDSQEAAECLAKEALTRMSRSNISCLVIRFD